MPNWTSIAPRSYSKRSLLAKQDFDAKKATYDAAAAALNEQQTRLAQARSSREQTAAQLAATQRRIAQAKAVLAQYSDMLHKYDSYAPIDGVVTNLPVRVGETVVPGANQSGRQQHHDHRRYVADHRRSQSGRNRHRERGARSDGRHHHRRHSQQDFQRPRDRNRQHRHPALHRRGRFAERRFQPGSQGFQSSGRHGRSARGNPSRPVLHGQDHHRHAARMR